MQFPISLCQLVLATTFLGSYAILPASARVPIKEPNPSAFTTMKLAGRAGVQPTGAAGSGTAYASGTGAGAASPTSFEVFVYDKNKAGATGTGGAKFNFMAEAAGLKNLTSKVEDPLASAVKKLQAQQT